MFLFILQFSISCVCLGVDEERELRLANKAWHAVDEKPFTEIHDVERVFECCGLDDADPRLTNTTDEIWKYERAWCIDTSWAWDVSCNNLLSMTPINDMVTTTETNTTSIEPTTTDTTTITSTTAEDPALGCPTCSEKLKSKIGYAFNMAGGFGLFFSFTEFVAIVVAYLYRAQCNNVTIIT